jgi:hypothetical protein
MPIEIRMPQLFSSNDEGTIVKWLIKEGQQIKPGDVIAEVETDEALVEIEAVEGGRVIKLLVLEGTRNVKVNAPIAMLETASGAAAQGAAHTAVHRVTTTAAPPPRAEGAGGRQEKAAPPPQAPPARTRLVGTQGPAAGLVQAPAFGSSGGAMPPAQAKTEYIRADQTQIDPVAGWVVVVKGPGRGAFRAVFVGMNSVGRDASQRVALGFGDDAISREEHAFITYDEEQRRFYIQHGGKANLVRLGKQPVLVPVELKANDLIRLGRTTLRFVPCCGPDFSWGDEIKEA